MTNLAILSYSQKLEKNVENLECDPQHNEKPQARTQYDLISALVAQKRDPKNQRNDKQQITARWKCRSVHRWDMNRIRKPTDSLME